MGDAELALVPDLGWLFYVQGVALTPAVVPIGILLSRGAIVQR